MQSECPVCSVVALQAKLEAGLLADIPGGPSSDMVVKDFHDALARSPDTAVAVAAIKVSSTPLYAASCSLALLQRPMPCS